MADTLRKRLENLELRFQPPKQLREIHAARAAYGEPLESHDSIRAKLGIQAEPGFIDVVVYCLEPGSAPRPPSLQEWQRLMGRPPPEAAAAGVTVETA